MMNFEFKTYEELSIDELYRMLALRSEVFVVEQESPYPDFDYYDQKSLHVMSWDGDQLIAYSRIVPPGVHYEQPSVGRVVVRKEYRGKKLGYKLFEESLKKTKELYPGQSIKIQAQCYLEDFYKAFGFKITSDTYPDYGVMHFDMILEVE